MIINYYLKMPQNQRKMIVHILQYNAKHLLYKMEYDSNENVKIVKRPDNAENSWYYRRRDYLTYLARKIVMSHYRYTPNYNELINLWVCTKGTMAHLKKKHYDGKSILRALTREWVIMLLVKAGNKYLHNLKMLSALKADYKSYIHNEYNLEQEHHLMVEVTKLIEEPQPQGVN